MFSIVDQTRGLVKKENELSAQIIRNLQKISNEKIHLQMSYSSLFTFCVKELGMSEAMAYRRCDAVKMSSYVKDLPEKLEQGSISLNRVGEVSKFIRQEKKEHGRSFHKKEVQKLVLEASRRENDSEARKYLMTKSKRPEAPPSIDKKQVMAKGRTKLEFEVDDEFLELLEQAKNLHSHLGPKKLGVFLKEILKNYLRQNHPAFKGLSKRGVRVQESLFQVRVTQEKSAVPMAAPVALRPNKARSALSYESRKPRSRAIPAAIKRKVWGRDGGRCTFKDLLSGRRCGSEFRIQFEHLKPFSLGGEHSEQNLTLRCQAHNLFAAKQLGLLRR